MKNLPFETQEPCSNDGIIRILRLTPKPSFMHQHTFFELVYVLQGSATRQIEGTNIRVTAGNYYITNPYSPHTYESTDDFETLNCLFLPECIDRALTDCPSISSLLSNRTLRFGVPMDLPISDQTLLDLDGSVKRIFRTMETEFTECRTGYMEVLRCCLTQILVRAARACEARIPHEAVTVVTDYLKENYMHPLSLQELSELAGYTPQYLSGLFSDEVGMSIQAYLQRLRIEQACQLLSHTKLPIPEIADTVGYRDLRHFSKIFRRYQNISPREYRKLHTH